MYNWLNCTPKSPVAECQMIDSLTSSLFFSQFVLRRTLCCRRSIW